MIFQTRRSKCALLGAVCVLVMGAATGAAADSITLEWDASSGQVGYKVHVGVQSGSYTQHFDVGSATQYTFPTATAGQRYCFAVSAYLMSSRLEGPNSSEVCGYSNAPPTLVNPGNRQSTQGQATTLQLVGSDPANQPLTYSATGLPAGLTLMASTGFISGTPTTATSYSVTVRASDGTLTASQSFTWTIAAGTTPDTTVPTVTIATPTSAATYSTTALSMNLGGTASDNRGVTQVSWANDRGGSGNATGTTSWSVNALALLTGTNRITVTARDAAGNLATDVVTVTVTTSTTNAAPTVNAGADQSVTLPASATLNGTATDDGRPNPPATLTRTWSKVSGPGTVTFGSPNAASTTASFSAAGAYVLRLSASDSALTATDDVAVTVNPASSGGGGTGTGLRGEYFASESFTTLAFTRTDPGVNFQWVFGSPGGGVQPDNFSVRWTGQITAPTSGSYTFSTVADDGVRLWVNGTQIINDWVPHAATTNTSPAVTLQAGVKYAIRLEYFERSHEATVQLRWAYPGQATTVIPATALSPDGATPPPPTSTPGLRGEYFSTIDFAGLAVLTRTDPNVDFSWVLGSPASSIAVDNFSVRWTGQITAPVTGSYTFSTSADDGVRLWVNGTQIINDWLPHAETVNTAPAITLQAGVKYTIRLEYFEKSHDATVRLRWAYPGQATQVIPASALSN